MSRARSETASPADDESTAQQIDRTDAVAGIRPDRFAASTSPRAGPLLQWVPDPLPSAPHTCDPFGRLQRRLIVKRGVLEQLIELARGKPSGGVVECWVLENEQELGRAVGADFVSELLEINFVNSDWPVRFERALLGRQRIRDIVCKPHPAAMRFATEIPILRDALYDALAEWGLEHAGLTSQLAELGHAVATVQLSDADLRTTARILEQLLGDDESIADAAATGFLEAYLHGFEVDAGARASTAWLGPRAQAYVDAWDQFCGVDQERSVGANAPGGRASGGPTNRTS